jgi:hypothetical protein
MGTRTYSRRSSTGEMVLTRLGRERAAVGSLRAIDVLGNLAPKETPSASIPPLTAVDLGVSALKDDLSYGLSYGNLLRPDDVDRYFPKDDPAVIAEMTLLGDGDTEEGRGLVRQMIGYLVFHQEIINKNKAGLKQIVRNIGSRPGDSEYQKAAPDIVSVMRQYIDGMNDTSRPEAARARYKRDLYGFLMNGNLPRGKTGFPPFTKNEVDMLISGYEQMKNSTQNKYIRSLELRSNESNLMSDNSKRIKPAFAAAYKNMYSEQHRAEDEFRAAIVLSSVITDARRRLSGRPPRQQNR